MILATESTSFQPKPLSHSFEINSRLWPIFGSDVEIAMVQEVEVPESVPREEDTSVGSLEEQLQQQKSQKDWGGGEGGCTSDFASFFDTFCLKN